MANIPHCRSQKLQLTSIDDTISRPSNHERKGARKQKRNVKLDTVIVEMYIILVSLILYTRYSSSMSLFSISSVLQFTRSRSIYLSSTFLSTSDYSLFPSFFSFLFSRVFSLRFTLSYRSYTGPTFFPPHCLSLLCSSNFLYVIPCMMFKPFS